MTRLLTLLLVGAVVMASVACTAADPTFNAPTPVPAVDMAAIAETAAAVVEQRLPEPAATVDLAALQADVLDAVEERLAAADPAAISQLVEDAVAAALAQQSQTIAITQRDAVAAAMEEAGLQASLVELYRQANPAVVYIIVPPVGAGTGFVYDDDGHIVTNNHVIDGGRSYEVVFASGERMAAELVGADADSDLAVIQVQDLPAGVDPLPLADPDALAVGQFVVAIGNPFGEQGSMSLGIVSGLGRSLRSQRGATASSSYSLPSVIQTDAPINPGNSGGPLLNLDGQVVGVNSAIASQTGVNSGVGFAIPVHALYQIVPSLIESGSHEYAYVGAGFDDEISLTDQSRFGLSQTQGAYVVSVTPGGPAAAAGLIAANPNTGQGGDLIVAIDGQPIDDFADLNGYLVFRAAPGQTIELTILREGREMDLSLTLGARP